MHKNKPRTKKTKTQNTKLSKLSKLSKNRIVSSQLSHRRYLRPSPAAPSPASDSPWQHLATAASYRCQPLSLAAPLPTVDSPYTTPPLSPSPPPSEPSFAADELPNLSTPPSNRPRSTAATLAGQEFCSACLGCPNEILVQSSASAGRCRIDPPRPKQFWLRVWLDQTRSALGCFGFFGRTQSSLRAIVYAQVLLDMFWSPTSMCAIQKCFAHAIFGLFTKNDMCEAWFRDRETQPPNKVLMKILPDTFVLCDSFRLFMLINY